MVHRIMDELQRNPAHTGLHWSETNASEAP
jgi:hypothetical protein